MLGEQELKSLLKFDAQHPVLSVYLNIEPAERGGEPVRRRLRALLRDMPAEAAADVQAAERYFEHEYDGSGRSVAVFSCAPAGFFQAFIFQLPQRPRARWLPQPYVKPLAHLLDAYGGYGLARVDKQGARLYAYHLGEMTATREVEGEAVRHTKRGGASTLAGRRGGTAGQSHHEEEIEQRNLRAAAEASAAFFQAHQVRRVLLAGTEETLAQFRALLPKAWQSLVVGSLATDRDAAAGDLLARAVEVGRRAEGAREAALVEGAVTAAAKGKAGATGLENTLRALHEGRVQTLMISEGYRAPGYVCSGCGLISAAEHAACPYCGSTSSAIEDAVEHAVRKAMRSTVEVEVVSGSRALEKAGRIAAVLRY
jgi:peptide chain release factor subunit 1